jgi:hypothetical protein
MKLCSPQRELNNTCQLCRVTVVVIITILSGTDKKMKAIGLAVAVSLGIHIRASSAVDRRGSDLQYELQHSTLEYHLETFNVEDRYRSYLIGCALCLATPTPPASFTPLLPYNFQLPHFSLF